MKTAIFSKIIDVTELFELAKNVLKEIEKKDLETTHKDKATIISLKGNLGAGKTTFTQILAKELGVQETVTSPTFVIQKRYPFVAYEQRFNTLVHIDAYRLEGDEAYIENEMLLLKFDEEFNNSKNLVVIEWPERLLGKIPAHFELSINLVDEDGDGEIVEEGEPAPAGKKAQNKRSFELCYVE